MKERIEKTKNSDNKEGNYKLKTRKNYSKK